MPRDLNGFFHVDDQLRLVKSSNNQPVPADEPLFILRGRDVLALETLRHYFRLAQLSGCNDYLRDGVNEAIAKFHTYASTHASQMKLPGITRGK